LFAINSVFTLNVTFMIIYACYTLCHWYL